MTKQQLVTRVIESMGYNPQIDNDSDVKFRFQLKQIYVMETLDEDTNYLVVVYPHFYILQEGEEEKALAACNKLTRDAIFAKVYTDEALTSVSACCEFYYSDEESITFNLERALEVLSVVHTAFYKEMDGVHKKEHSNK